VANEIQFEGSKRTQREDDCTACEAMLTDALDGTLSADEQASFDAHIALCSRCSQMLADAQRGAAWLELLRLPRPEPSADLMHRILAQTSEAPATGSDLLLTPATVLPVPMPIAPARSNVLPFRSRVAYAVRSSGLAQIVFQPRLAMTAAMAFFSIALTMNLTGVKLQDLSDLRPSTLKRDFYSANASAVRYYEGLRVVYELESRVHDLQSASDDDATAGSQTGSPTTQPASTPDEETPAGKSSPKVAPHSERQSDPTDSRPTPNSGTSRILTRRQQGGLA
jgi:hypothetical protein